MYDPVSTGVRTGNSAVSHTRLSRLRRQRQQSADAIVDEGEHPTTPISPSPAPPLPCKTRRPRGGRRQVAARTEEECTCGFRQRRARLRQHHAEGSSANTRDLIATGLLVTGCLLLASCGVGAVAGALRFVPR